MGGKAFASAVADEQPAITIQRLDAAEYRAISSQVCRALLAYICDARILVPPSFSAKEDFGDIDILISTAQEVDWAIVASKLYARAWIDQGSRKAPICSLAVRTDGEPSMTATQYFLKKNSQKQEAARTTSERYAQIDISVVPQHELQWRNLCSSYSDMGSILGRLARRFGFKINTQGFWVMMKELDQFKDALVPVADAEGTVFLSGDTADIMKWLCLDVSVYNRGFRNAEEMFEWLDNCRLSIADLPLRRGDDSKNDSRQISRPVLLAFITRQEERRKTQTASDSDTYLSDIRQELLVDAVGHFNKQGELDAKAAALEIKWRNAVANERLRELLSVITNSSEKSIAATLRGFRRFVTTEHGEPIVLEQPLPDESSQLHHFLDSTSQSLQTPFARWAKQHHAEMKTLGKKPMPQQLLRSEVSAV